MTRRTPTPESIPLKKGDVRYLGYRPELEANLYAVRPADGMPPEPLARLLAQAPAMLALIQELSETPCDHGTQSWCPRANARALLRAVEAR